MRFEITSQDLQGKLRFKGRIEIKNLKEELKLKFDNNFNKKLE